MPAMSIAPSSSAHQHPPRAPRAALGPIQQRAPRVAHRPIQRRAPSTAHTPLRPPPAPAALSPSAGRATESDGSPDLPLPRGGAEGRVDC